MHNDFARKKPEWDDRIEVAYLSVTALKTFKSQTSKIAIISPGEPFHVKEAGKDWLVNWYMVRERGRTLFGPAPAAVIGPISREEFIHCVEEHVAAWGDRINDISRRRPSQAYAILTMCRALYTHEHGEQVSKRQAAQWAMQELPEWAPLIQRAVLWREGQRDAQVDDEASFPQTVEFVQYIIRQVVGR